MRLKSPATPTDGGTDGAAGTDPAEKPIAYRTFGSLAMGAVLAAFGLLFLVSFGFGSDSHPVGATAGLLMVVAGAIGGLYPAAYSYADRLEIRNPFRRIVVSWPRVDTVSARLSTVVETVPEAGTAKKFTIWAIPVSMHERRKSDRVASKANREARAEAAKRTADAETRLLSGGGFGMTTRHHRDPLETMAFADQAVSELKDRKAACPTSMEKAAATSVTWTWYTLAPFGAAVALLVAAVAGAF